MHWESFRVYWSLIVSQSRLVSCLSDNEPGLTLIHWEKEKAFWVNHIWWRDRKEFLLTLRNEVSWSNQARNDSRLKRNKKLSFSVTHPQWLFLLSLHSLHSTHLSIREKFRTFLMRQLCSSGAICFHHLALSKHSMRSCWRRMFPYCLKLK